MKLLKPWRWAGVVLASLVAILVSAQLVGPQNANLTTDPNHSIAAAVGAPTDLSFVIDRACGECHSHTMSTRWYTKVAPFSYIMARAAREGRKVVNFAEWAGYAPDQQRAFLAASCTAARKGTMPVSAYVRFRPDARLSPRDIATICSASR